VELAANSGTTPDVLAGSIVKLIADKGGKFLATNEQPQMLAVMHFFLSHPTERLDRPGVFRDHFGSWDFNIKPNADGEGAFIEVMASWPAAAQA